MSVQDTQRIDDTAYSAVQRVSSYIAEGATGAYQYASNMCEEYLPSLHHCAKKVEEIAIPILRIAIGLLLFTSQSSMFVLGSLVSILNPDFMHTSIDRICLIWNGLSISGKVVAIAGGIIAFPITTAISSFFVGGAFALDLLQKAYSSQEQVASEMQEITPNSK